MRKISYMMISISLIASMTIGCSNKTKETKESITEGGMKCGAGKCGASMVDGDTYLSKKKKRIISQMRDDDLRKDCVLSASTTKKLYDCIRDPESGRLTTKCGADNNNDKAESKEEVMKCAAGKCGGK